MARPTRDDPTQGLRAWSSAGSDVTGAYHASGSSHGQVGIPVFIPPFLSTDGPGFLSFDFRSSSGAWQGATPCSKFSELEESRAAPAVPEPLMNVTARLRPLATTRADLIVLG